VATEFKRQEDVAMADTSRAGAPPAGYRADSAGLDAPTLVWSHEGGVGGGPARPEEGRGAIGLGEEKPETLKTMHRGSGVPNAPAASVAWPRVTRGTPVTHAHWAAAGRRRGPARIVRGTRGQ
jgi:hypothetical protein